MEKHNPEILLIDDDPLVRETLPPLLHAHGFPMVTAVAEPFEVKRVFRQKKIDVLICDIMLAHDKNGIDLVKELRTAYDFLLVFISGSPLDVFEKTRVLKPDGYLVKPFSERQLITSIRLIWDSREVNETAATDEKSLLSAREAEVLHMLCKGLSSRDIAETLGISIYTAQTHRNRAMKKLEVNTIQKLLIRARELGY